MRSNLFEREGVFSLAKAVTSELEWVFKEQTTSDFGIDAFIEQCEI